MTSTKMQFIETIDDQNGFAKSKSVEIKPNYPAPQRQRPILYWRYPAALKASSFIDKIAGQATAPRGQFLRKPE